MNPRRLSPPSVHADSSTLERRDNQHGQPRSWPEGEVVEWVLEKEDILTPGRNAVALCIW